MLSVVFAAAGPADHLSRIQAALPELAAFYRGVGDEPRASSRSVAGGRGVVGWIALTEAGAGRLRSEAENGALRWGEPVPGGLRTGDQLLTATDDELKAQPGWGASIAWSAEAVRAVTSPAPPTALYRARGEAVHAVASHAAVAAWLAGLPLRIRPDALAELLTFEFVLGESSLVEGTLAVPAASVLELGTGFRPRSSWPAADRWKPVGQEEEAAGLALDALLGSLETRLAATASPRLGLTAGLDSRVVAAATKALGSPTATFTWSHHEFEAVEAASVAAQIGAEHEWIATEDVAEAEGMRLAGAHARWSEGQARTTPFGRVLWPEGATAFVTGAAGEVARAFYYRLEAANHARPGVEQLGSIFRLRARLPYADRATVERMDARVVELIAEAEASGHRGWSLLDVFYAEQRVTRWGRAMLAPVDFPTIPAFASPEVMRAFASLPLEDRVSDGFHRYALAQLGYPQLAPPPSGGQRRGIPRPVRRASAWARRRRHDRQPAPWIFADRLGAYPEYRAWLVDEVLRSTTLASALGPDWISWLARGPERGEDEPMSALLIASSTVAFEAGLREIRPW